MLLYTVLFIMRTYCKIVSENRILWIKATGNNFSRMSRMSSGCCMACKSGKNMTVQLHKFINRASLVPS